MPKRTRKLLVYLDQNFLSEMSKTDSHENVRPEFREIYELLHRGFVGEKLVVPGSVLHDIESSLATHLKDRIAACQNHVGQVRLRRPDEIENRQVEAALGRFSGRTSEDPLRPAVPFLDDPDQPVQRLGIRVDAHLERYNFRATRQSTGRRLEDLRQRLLRDGIGYDQQLKVERQRQRDEFLHTYFTLCRPLSDNDRQRFTAFAESSEFTQIPLLSIEARLFAALLTRKPTRVIKDSDAADIEILSAYAPYMDVVCTDAFMAEQLRSLGIDREYSIELFHAKTNSLRKLNAFLEGYLSNAVPVHRPSITVFVLPPKHKREQSACFFRQLGDALRAMGIGEYGEIYAFDDGAMPNYECRQLSGERLSFYGLEDVARLRFPDGAGEDEILKICREHCRSDHFVLIDEYKEIADGFMLGAAMCAESAVGSVDGYRIFKKQA